MKKREFLLFLVISIYFIIKLYFISLAYLDFGDGNYLYISWRISCGDILYKNIISPQPPVMLYLWAPFHRIIKDIFVRTYFFRIISIFIHILCALFVYLIAKRVFKNWRIAILSLFIYLFLPIGFWWFRCVESEPLEILFSLIAFYHLLYPNKKNMIIAGFFSALAFCTNMTYLPYYILLLIVGFLFKRKKFFSFFWTSILFIIVIYVFSFLQSGFSVFENIFLNQFNTYKGGIWYFLSKIYSFGGIIFVLEGSFIVLFFMGIFCFLKREITYKNTLLILYSLQSFGSYFFVTKGGTVDYIFTIGEPFIALWSAFALFLISKTFLQYVKKYPFIFRIILWVGFFHFLMVLFFMDIKYDIETLQGKNYEICEKKIKEIVGIIKHYSRMGDEILAPPYYAYLSQRKIAYNLSSSYIILMKYLSGDKKIKNMIENKLVSLIKRKKIKIILLNENQYGKISVLKKSIMENYRKIKSFTTRHESIDIYVPR